MDNEITDNKDETSEAREEQPHARERAQFRSLLLSNPNYFGNLKDSQFKAILQIQANTFYENICSVGFQPQFDRLEAVVHIKQPTGYGGDICSQGTPEYVRFFFSTDNGATWDDLGLTSFTAYDIPVGTTGRRELEYAVTLEIDPKKTFCFIENLAQVRAILSWNAPPPPNSPNFIPVWGDIHNTHIQIDPWQLFLVKDLFKELEIEIDLPKLAQVLDLDKPLEAIAPKELSVADLHRQYREQKVEPHRYALTELQKFIDQPALSADLMAGGGQSFLSELEIDWSQIGDLLNPTNGNTSYEELECIGLNSRSDTLAGVIRLKRPSGYNGDLCHQGSREYVTFWADLNNNGFYETCLGTTSVGVHDIASIPDRGLEYAVFLPVDLTKYKKPCEDGPVVIPIRAILSWNVAPPCFNPNYVPVWGNRLHTLIHVYPARSSQPGTHFPIIQTAGSMDVGQIDSVTGLANGDSPTVGCLSADDSPFGGVVVLTGHIGNAPDISNGATKLKYRVEYTQDNTWGSYQIEDSSFTLKRDRLLNGIWSNMPDITQDTDATGWYDYEEDLTNGPGNAMYFPVGNVLARWNTAGLSDGVWYVRIRTVDPANPGPIWTSNVVTIKVDNTPPVAKINITSGGGACADFTIGDVINGTYEATDNHFRQLTLSVEPALGGSFTTPAPLPAGSTMPLTRTYDGGVSTFGEAGNWSLDTSGMPQCGYVIRLRVWDRTIVGGGCSNYADVDVVGLCLREPNA
ncbi:MAG: hypothetical protein ACK2U6_12475 [Candidatus Promineifilaceae bacterium]